MLSPAYIASLDDDPDRLAALVYLAEQATPYPPGLFVPPLEAPTKGDRERETLSVWMTSDVNPNGPGRSLTEVHVDDSLLYAIWRQDGPESLSAFLARCVFTSRYACRLVVCQGDWATDLDVLLEDAGPSLLAAGYTIEPCLGAGAIAWMRVKRGKRTWTITTPQTMTGVDLTTLLAFARDAGRLSECGRLTAASITDAIAVYRSFLSSHFGVALRPTVSMIASACARRFLPPGLTKWRPVPLLVAIERAGLGYRGGIAWGGRYRGQTHRIDVNRQYAAMLQKPLPLRVAFGKYDRSKPDAPGVYVCTLRSSRHIQYPIGVWCRERGSFIYSQIAPGESVCVLHTAEFAAMADFDCEVEPGYGYQFTATFDLRLYVERLQQIVDEYGKSSATGRLVKPLGNMVYGKFGQRPGRVQLLYADKRPDLTWHPYYSPEGEDVDGVWERRVERHTSGQHVDIAATVAAYARCQTAQAWALLDALGYHVVRSHTDSITTIRDSRDVMATDPSLIGAWSYESEYADTIILGANAYSDERGGHVGGVSSPTVGMVETAFTAGTAEVTQTERAPRVGWSRGTRVVEKRVNG